MKFGLLGWAVLLLHCGGESPAPMSLDAAVDSEPSLELPDLPATPGLCAHLEDSHGAPRASVPATLCSSKICLSGKSDGEGSLCFHPMPGEYYLHAVGDAELHFGDLFFPVSLDTESTKWPATLGEHLIQPSVPERQTVTVATGGTLRFKSGDIALTIPAGVLQLPSHPESGLVAALQVPLAEVDARLLATHSGTPEAVYLLLPQGAKLKPMPNLDVVLSLETALPTGTKLEVALADPATAHLRSNGAAEVSNGRIVSTAGHGLTGFGWIALYRQ